MHITDLDAHALGIYTTALFLTQILASKFVPPLNEVAFAAYSRIQTRPDRFRQGVLGGGGGSDPQPRTSPRAKSESARFIVRASFRRSV